ncbi:MAG: hypothetical protein KW793_01295 [Candidatus Doudnabacteria bacterium]|nr:hypothetical protein [Candidatus Doudnabacteria bacterium]
MAKRKTNWSEIHKIKIHDNRMLAWAIALAILACASLIGYIQVSQVHFENQMAEYINSTTTWHTFTHKAGFSFKYPRNWGIESEGASSISFVSPTNADEYFSVTIYPASDEKTVAASLFQTKQATVKVGGINAVKISQERTQAESVVMVKDSGNLIILRGKGVYFDRIVDTFKFSEKLERV